MKQRTKGLPALMRRVFTIYGGQPDSKKDAKAALREAGYPEIKLNTATAILYKGLRDYGYPLVKVLRNNGTSATTCLRLVAKAYGLPIPATQGEMLEALQNAGVDADRIAQVISGFLGAEKVKVYKGPDGLPIEAGRYPDYDARAKVLPHVIGIRGDYAPQKLDVRGAVIHGVAALPPDFLLRIREDIDRGAAIEATLVESVEDAELIEDGEKLGDGEILRSQDGSEMEEDGLAEGL